jgi:uncharacterized protein
MRVHDLSEPEAAILSMSNEAFSAIFHLECDPQIAKAIMDLQEKALAKTEREMIHMTPPRFVRTDLDLSNLMVNLSEECNLSCRYCLAQQGSYGREGGRMSEQAACECIDFLARQSKDGELTVSFFGGEPLLNLQAIKAIIKYSRKMEENYGRKVIHHLTTNGTLFDEETISFLKESGCKVTVSLDGGRENHDLMRVYPDGRGSFDRICLSLPTLLDGYRENVQFESTLHTETCDFAETARFLKSFGAGRIYIHHARGFVKEFRLDDVSISIMKRAYSEFANYILEDAIANGSTILSAFSHFISALASGKRARAYCAAGINLLSVSKDGRVYPCPGFVGMEDYALGDIRQGIDPEKMARLRERLADVDTISACRSCWARYLCAGGCIAESAAINGSPWQPDHYSCDLNRHIAELSIWIYAELLRQRPEFFLSLQPIPEDIQELMAS